MTRLSGNILLFSGNGDLKISKGFSISLGSNSLGFANFGSCCVFMFTSISFGNPCLCKFGSWQFARQMTRERNKQIFICVVYNFTRSQRCGHIRFLGNVRNYSEKIIISALINIIQLLFHNLSMSL